MKRLRLFLVVACLCSVVACLCFALLHESMAQKNPAQRSKPKPVRRSQLTTTCTPQCPQQQTHPAAQVYERSGDINVVYCGVCFFQRDSDSNTLHYEPPNKTQLDTWRDAIKLVLTGDNQNLATAAQKLHDMADSYKVIKFTDTSGPSPRLYILVMEAEVTSTQVIPILVKGWGSYFFDLAPDRDLVIEVPHPKADENTEGEGILALTQLRPRALLLFGAHRCASCIATPAPEDYSCTSSYCVGTNKVCAPMRREIPNSVSDASHAGQSVVVPSPSPTPVVITNTFQVVHEELLTAFGSTIAIQFHGNAECDKAVILSNSSGNSNSNSSHTIISGGNVSRLKARLDSVELNGTNLSTAVCNGVDTPGCGFCGTDNLQGRWANGASLVCSATMDTTPAPTGVERFIHVEQSQEMRDASGSTIDTMINRQRMVDAIGNTMFIFPTSLRIDTVAPHAGRKSGGQSVILTGAFAGLSSTGLTFGGISNVQWHYTNGANDTSSITIDSTPAHEVGAVDITLMAGSTSVTKQNAFAYLPTTFMDNTLDMNVTVKVQHILELRQAVDALRAVAGLTGASWTDPTLTPTATKIKAVHVQELRTFLDDAATRLGYSTAPYTDPSLIGIVIRRVHIEELRQRIRTIAG